MPTTVILAIIRLKRIICCFSACNVIIIMIGILYFNDLEADKHGTIRNMNNYSRLLSKVVKDY